jgi:hypothetical protein
MAIRYLSGVNIDSNTLVVDSTNNRVGINTASPDYALDLGTSGTGNQIRARRIYANGTGTESGYTLDSTLIFQGASNSFNITNPGSYPSVAFTINSSGNVGIGTTSPTVTLEVSGRGLITSSGSSDTFAVTHSSGSGIGVNITKGGNGEGLYVNKTSGSGNAVTIVGTLNATTLVKSGGTSSQYLMADGSVSTLTNPVTGTGTTNYVPKWTSGSAIGNSQIFDNGTNVGIGTASPGSKLDVDGDIGYTASSAIYPRKKSVAADWYVSKFDGGSNIDNSIGSSGDTAFRIGYWGGGTFAPNIKLSAGGGNSSYISSGNVGIGTTCPSQWLEVNGNIQLTTKANSIIFGPSGADGIWSAPIITRIGSQIIVSDFSGVQFGGYNGSAYGPRMTVLGTGNVGIGTESPTSIGTGITTLDIQGSNAGGVAFGPSGVKNYIYGASTMYVEAHTTAVFNTSGSEKMRITSAGNVGIGTTSPVSPLDVNGIISSRGTHIAQNSGTYNIIYNASNSIAMYLGGSADPGNYYDNTTHYFRSSGGGTTYATINSFGSVGIGTTSPADRLYVGNTAGTSISVSTNLAAGTNGSPLNLDLNFRGYADVKMAMIRSWDESASTGNGHLTFWTNEYTGVNVFTEKMRIGPTGSIKLNSYGSGTKTGTATQRLAVDASGNVIEIPIGSGPVDGNGTANYVTKWSDADTITNSQIFDNGTNVGIGTATPSSKLDVVGAIISTGTYQARMIGAAGGAYFGSMSAVPVIFQVNQNEVARFDGSGNFSIATTTVQNPAAGRGNITIGGTSSSILNFGYNDSDNGYIFHNGDFNIVNRVSTKPLIFGTEGTERMRITSAGNIGVGIAAPQNRLSIGSAQDAGIDFLYDGFNNYKNQIKNYWNSGTDTRMDFNIGNTSGVAPVTVMSVGYGGNVGIGTTSPAVKLHTVGDGLFFSNTNTNLTINSNGGAASLTLTNTAGNQVIYGGVGGLNAMDFYTGSAFRMRIDASGNVGIGTTSPSSKLHVSGDTYVTGQFAQGVAVASKITGYGAEFRSSNASAQIFFGRSGDSIGSGGIGADETSTFIVWSIPSFVKLLVVNQNGNVGINTDAPSQKLHVAGNLRVTGAYYDSNNEAGTSGQVLTSTGTGTDWKSLSEITGVDGTGTANYVAKWSDTDTIANSQIRDDGTTVGIGTAPAAAKLTVNGPVNVGGRYLYNNFQPYLDTTGVNVAGLSTSTNGDSAFFTFEAGAGDGQYQRIVYSCYNAGGTWSVVKVIDEGTNRFDVVASASSGSTITFTWKSRSGIIYYTPRLIVTGVGSINTSYL